MRYNNSFYSARPWRQCRGSFLKHNPTCFVPGCTERSTQVDHIKSRKDGGADYDWSNLRGVCTSHHSQLTVGKNGGFGRKPDPDFKPRVIGCTISGAPKDPKHPWNQPRAT